MKKILLAIACAAGLILGFGSCNKDKITTWEYKVVRVDAQLDTTYNEDFSTWAPKHVMFDNNELNALGAQGWELVAVHDEIETKFAQTAASGNGVMGLKSNTRTSAVLLLFKRQKKYE